MDILREYVFITPARVRLSYLWDRTAGGPNEKDRQLLVEFDVVIEEFKRLDERSVNPSHA